MSPTRTEPFADERPGPLAGIVVADLSRIMAGPYCTMLLADMGATVIKIESPAGDDTRRFMPPIHDGVATYYQSANRNKRSVVLDFTNVDELAATRRIIEHSDIVVENFKPGGLARFGLDYPTLSREHPGLIYASITGFGTGAGARYPGYDLVIQALSGFMDTTGRPDGEPTRAGFALFDVFTGLQTAVGILAALHHRDLTGHGQLVETDLLSSALASMANQTQAVLTGGILPTRMGNEHPSLYPYEPFPTADQPLVIAVGNDSQFIRLCELLGRPDLATDPDFASIPLRNANRAALRSQLSALLAGRTAAEWFERLSAAGVPCAPIHTIAQGIEFAERVGLSPAAEAGPQRLPGARNPLRFSATPVDYPLAPPALGEHTTTVLARLRDVIAEEQS